MAKDQGKIVVEREGGGFLMMMPDGQVRYAPNERQVQRAARSFFRSTLGKANVGIGRVEWRGHTPEVIGRAQP